MKGSVVACGRCLVAGFFALAFSCENSDHFKRVRDWRHLDRMSKALEAHRITFGEYPIEPWSAIAKRFTSGAPIRDAWGDAFHYQIRRGSDGSVTGYILFTCAGDNDCNLGGAEGATTADPMVIESSIWRVREPPRYWATDEIGVGLSDVKCRWVDPAHSDVSCSMVVEADEGIGESESGVECSLFAQVRAADEEPPGVLHVSSRGIDVRLGEMAAANMSFSCDAACRQAEELLIVVTLLTDEYRLFDRDLRDNVRVARLRAAQ